MLSSFKVHVGTAAHCYQGPPLTWRQHSCNVIWEFNPIREDEKLETYHENLKGDTMLLGYFNMDAAPRYNCCLSYITVVELTVKSQLWRLLAFRNSCIMRWRCNNVSMTNQWKWNDLKISSYFICSVSFSLIPQIHLPCPPFRRHSQRHSASAQLLPKHPQVPGQPLQCLYHGVKHHVMI